MLQLLRDAAGQRMFERRLAAGGMALALLQRDDGPAAMRQHFAGAHGRIVDAPAALALVGVVEHLPRADPARFDLRGRYNTFRSSVGIADACSACKGSAGVDGADIYQVVPAGRSASIPP